MKKEQKEKKVLVYVKSYLKKGIYPKGTELHKKFRIYDEPKIFLADIYEKLNINLLSVPKKPNNTKQRVRKLLIKYIKSEVKNKHYPSRREIENKFNLKLETTFKGIEDLYQEAGVLYKRLENQEIKYQKAKKLLEIILKRLNKNKFRIIQTKQHHQQGIDIIIGTSRNGKIGIELKAYNKFERVKRKDIKQLERFYQSHTFQKIWLITTTNRVPKEIPKWLEIIKYEDIKKWCNRKEVEILKEIHRKSVHQETTHRLEKKQLIVNYIKENSENGKLITAREILKDLKLCVYSYFKNMDEAYEISKIDIPLSRLQQIRTKELREKVTQKNLEKILYFIKTEVKKGHYPSGVDIGKKFSYSHIWNRYRVSDLYRTLGLPTYLERKSRFIS